jgi:hypothetical protein
MLVLADRGFFSFGLWAAAAAAGVALCWRVKKNSILPVLAELPDGSCLSRMYPSNKARCEGAGATFCAAANAGVLESFITAASFRQRPPVTPVELVERFANAGAPEFAARIRRRIAHPGQARGA